MDRIVGLLPCRQVAARVATIGRLSVQRIVAADVALRASHHLARRGELVRVRQRETGSAVIKLAVCPNRNRVA